MNSVLLEFVSCDDQLHALESLLFQFERIIKEKFVKVASSSQLSQHNDQVIRYLETTLAFIANDTDKQLQFI